MCIVAVTLQEAKEEEEEIKFLRVWEIVGGRIGEGGGGGGHDLKKAKQGRKSLDKRRDFFKGIMQHA